MGGELYLYGARGEGNDIFVLSNPESLEYDELRLEDEGDGST